MIACDSCLAMFAKIRRPVPRVTIYAEPLVRLHKLTKMIKTLEKVILRCFYVIDEIMLI